MCQLSENAVMSSNTAQWYGGMYMYSVHTIAHSILSVCEMMAKTAGG